MTDDRPNPRPDLTPPPHEPMRTERKRALREQLLAAVERPSGSPRRSWVVPSLAAAAVLAIVGAGAYAVTGDGGGHGDTLDPLRPAGTAQVPVTSNPPSSVPSTKPSSVPSTKPSSVASDPPSSGGTSVPHVRQPPAQNCADAVVELIQQGTPELAGAQQTASRPGPRGTTYLYESRSAWVVCDDFSAGDGGAPTLFGWHKASDPYVPSAKTLQISENTIGEKPSRWHYQYVAGGRDFDGVRAISYTFPDGHTEDAVLGQDGFWSMNYQPTQGPLADPRTNYTTLDPITVTVTHTQAGGGGTDTFSLGWGPGTCGQTNHGC